MDGISFYPQLIGKKGEIREWSLCHYQDQYKPDYVRFVQTADYKLYLDGRFYNTRKDPLEKKDLLKGVASAKEEDLRLKLRQVLESIIRFGGKDIDNRCPIDSFLRSNSIRRHNVAFSLLFRGYILAELSQYISCGQASIYSLAWSVVLIF